MIDSTRQEALSAARAAVRAYARDPSDGNASNVEAAWTVLRRLDAVSVWRREQRPMQSAERRQPSER